MSIADRHITGITTMKAIVQDEYGSADVLRLAEIDRPAIGTGEVLIQVHAAGLERGTAAHSRARSSHTEVSGGSRPKSLLFRKNWTP